MRESRGSSTSRLVAAARTRALARRGLPSARRRRGRPLLTTTAGCTVRRPVTRPARSSATWPSAACSWPRGPLRAGTRTAGAATRRSSPHLGRVLSVEELRQPLLDANATVESNMCLHRQPLDDWLRNVGRLEDMRAAAKQFFVIVVYSFSFVLFAASR